MEPRIKYAKTSDGVNIAYWTLGEGLPHVWPQTVTRCNGLHHLVPPVSATAIAWLQHPPCSLRTG